MTFYVYTYAKIFKIIAFFYENIWDYEIIYIILKIVSFLDPNCLIDDIRYRIYHKIYSKKIAKIIKIDGIQKHIDPYEVLKNSNYNIIRQNFYNLKKEKLKEITYKFNYPEEFLEI